MKVIKKTWDLIRDSFILTHEFGPWIQKVTIAPEDWAPGLWAGSEGWEVKMRVKSVDLENRIVEFEMGIK